MGLPWTHWIKPHNVGWLNIRGLESTGSAPEVKERVKEYMERPGGPPEVLPPTGGSTELTLSVIQAWSALVSRLMAATMNSSAITEIERAIHIFLSRYAEFDVHVGDGSATPTWIGAYNFMSLLNLPDALREFGPLRPLWEGGYLGEGYLRTIKPLLCAGLRKNWEVNVLTNVLLKRSMESVMATLDEEPLNLPDVVERNSADTQDDITEPNVVRFADVTSAYVYSGPGEVLRAMSNADALSFVQTTTKQFGCLVRDGRKAGLMKLQLESFVQRRNGMNYHSWTVGDDTPLPLEVNSIFKYGLLLPLLGTDGIPKASLHQHFTAIDSEWGELNTEGTTFITPSMSCEPDVTAA